MLITYRTACPPETRPGLFRGERRPRLRDRRACAGLSFPASGPAGQAERHVFRPKEALPDCLIRFGLLMLNANFHKVQQNLTSEQSGKLTALMSAILKNNNQRKMNSEPQSAFQEKSGKLVVFPSARL
ncbi:MAG: hypothetical protein LBW85_02745 [Deltaproteobacteria bacterium]|jgi:hypothetical protein|nr:hypothetical protein [Deltaproteobacteria bacterium]